VRIIEERGRGTDIKKGSDLQHTLDHQAAMQREIKVGVGLCENGRVLTCG
jgi:hypothetical protein